MPRALIILLAAALAAPAYSFLSLRAPAAAVSGPAGRAGAARGAAAPPLGPPPKCNSSPPGAGSGTVGGRIALVRVRASGDGQGGAALGSDGAERMRQLVGDLLSSEDEVQTQLLLGDNVRFLLQPETPQRFAAAKKYFRQYDEEELSGVFRSMVDFLEEFVHTTRAVERSYQEMLRELIECAQEGEGAFDAKLDSFDAGLTFEFLRYLDGQIAQLSLARGDDGEKFGPNAPNVSLLRTIRVRVSALLDEAFGEQFAGLTRVLAIDEAPVRQRAFLASLNRMGDDEVAAMRQLLEHIAEELEEEVEKNAPLDRKVLGVRVADLLAMVRSRDPGEA